MSDLIERDKVLDQLCLNHKDVVYIDKNECARRIKAIPSARPKGEWVDWLGNGNEWECSVCKCSVESHGSIAYNYCPMCGADMREREGE